MILNPLVTLIAKVEAFIGDIPLSTNKQKYKHKKHAITNPAATADEITPANIINTAENNKGTIAATTLVVNDDTEIFLPLDVRNNLKTQTFVKVERMKECLDNCQLLGQQCIPELRNFLKVLHICVIYFKLIFKTILVIFVMRLYFIFSFSN
jgi:hypothetical protein